MARLRFMKSTIKLIWRNIGGFAQKSHWLRGVLCDSIAHASQ